MSYAARAAKPALFETQTSVSTGLIAEMFSPRTAWRIVRSRTGSPLSKASFYRWIRSGKVYSVRLGYRIYVPRPALEDVIRRCLEGER
jgi:hypothetical protein